MSIGPVIGTAINAIIGNMAKKAAEKISDEDYSLLGEHFTVRQPGIKLVGGIFLILMFGGGGLLFLLYTFDQTIEYYRSVETVWDAISPPLLAIALISPMCLLGTWAILMAAKWSVQVDGGQIVYTSFTGKKRNFTFKDITGVTTYTEQANEAIMVSVGGKVVFAADPTCINYYVLLSRLKSEQVPFPD